MLYSFDIFDTALTRIWANPTDLFWELGQTLRQQNLISISNETWQKYRIEAERNARHRSKTGEVQLRDIYAQLPPMIGWTESHIQQAMQLEIDLENASLRAIPATQEQIQKLRHQGHSINFISDMYLPSAAIRDFLTHYQIWETGDELHVSGDVGVSKASSKLFSHFLTQKGLRPDQLTHTGDNAHADIKMAQTLGIQTQEFRAAHLNRYEQAIVTNNDLPLKFRSLLAGTSRLCRLNNPETIPNHQAIWDTATNVIAPVLFGYVHWCIQEAQKHGIKRLYFVARDGQVLHKIAQVICQKWDYDIDCRYFYGSRLAFHFPAIEQIGERELEWIFNGEKNSSIQSFFAKVHCDPSEFAEVLVENGLPKERWSEYLDATEQKLVKRLFQELPIANTIVTRAAAYREQAISYFQQEGMGDGTPFALIDIGWSGKSQTSFSKLLNIGGMYPQQGIRGFYFGIQFPATPFQQDTATGYFFYPGNPSERTSLLYRELLELFVYADHPSTTAYEKSNGAYQPVFREKVSQAALDWGIKTQQNAIVTFSEHITDVISREECASDYFHHVADTVLRMFMFSPSHAEAEAYGSFKFSPNITEDLFFEFAKPYCGKDFVSLFKDLRSGQMGARWLAASIQRSSSTVRPLMQLATASSRSRELLNLAQEKSRQNQAQAATSLLWKAVKEYPVIISKKCFIKTSVYVLQAYAMKPKVPVSAQPKILF